MTGKDGQDTRYWLTDAGYDAIDDAPETPQLILVPLMRFPAYADVPKVAS